MARYIDADKINFKGVEPILYNHNYYIPLKFAEAIIRTAPTADVVEVVRCKDCIYAEKHYDTTHLIGNTYYHSGAPTRLLYITCKHRKGKLEERDFCSCGKRNLSELPTD